MLLNPFIVASGLIIITLIAIGYHEYMHYKHPVIDDHEKCDQCGKQVKELKKAS